MKLFSKIAGVAAILMIFGVTSAPAETKSEVWPSGRTGKIGLGLDLNALNFGVGPLAKYWISDNMGVQASYTMGTLTGYAVRGIYGFDNDLLIGGQNMTPYAGIGYASAETKLSNVTVKGSAPQVFGGAEGRLLNWGPNWYWTGEVAYAPMTLEATAPSVLGLPAQKVTASYNAFTFGASLVYYFK